MLSSRARRATHFRTHSRSLHTVSVDGNSFNTIIIFIFSTLNVNTHNFLEQANSAIANNYNRRAKKKPQQFGSKTIKHAYAMAFRKKTIVCDPLKYVFYR